MVATLFQGLFLFVDGSKTKKRPALVLSNKEFNRNNHTILAIYREKGFKTSKGDYQMQIEPGNGFQSV